MQTWAVGAFTLVTIFGLIEPIVASDLPEKPQKDVVDAGTLKGKVLCGYQGWFRCPGDPSGLGWIHWSRKTSEITPRTISFEMWPDVRDYGRDELFAAPKFTHPDGRK